ncbi:chemotaxis-specific protein-glutamate methyltransferase CheB [Desulfobacterales bacterium HSG17]|nr:chemotaxis-specific protein-glutamate methyltransferase CheB [Desulfobacterales bacterium HSG17]
MYNINPKLINILIVEDSPVVRELLIYILNSSPGINVMGTVDSGEKALKFVKKYKPDLITMDVNMPGIDGFETTRRIMETQPVPIIIVSSIMTPESADALFRTMEAGALCIVEKPPGLENSAYKQKSKKLVEIVKLMSEVKVVRRRSLGVLKKPEQQLSLSGSSQGKKYPNIKLVAIGVSTGGPPAIQTILSLLPKNIGVPILIVQHIARGFIQGMADWLGPKTGFPVHIPEHGDILLPGHVYLAPDNYHMGVSSNNTVLLSKEKPENGIRPSVSFLLRSVSKIYGKNAAGVLLTGMGRDGAKELLLMKENKAVTLVQDKKSCVIFGMPDAAIKMGAAAYVLPPDKIAQKLIQLIL